MTLKLVLRNLRKHPFLNLIKIIGLSLGLSSFLLILLFMKRELSYDSFHRNADRIYRFTTTSPDFFSGKHFARIYRPSYVPDLKEHFPGIENYLRLAPVSGGALKLEEKFVTFSQGFLVDSTYPEVFDVQLLQGNIEEILDQPASMIISESFALKVFGETDPSGMILSIPAGQFYGEQLDFTVRGIMKDLPRTSHIHPDFISTPNERSQMESWAWTYLLLQKNAAPDDITDGIKDFALKYLEANEEEFNSVAHMQKITDIHLKSKKTREIEPNSSMAVIWSFSIAAILLLFIALFNYANLNMGMAGYSDRYLFVSKVFGSSKRMHIRFFITEALTIALVSLLLSLLVFLFARTYVIRNFALDLARGETLLIILIALLFSLADVFTGILPVARQYLRQMRVALNLSGSTGIKRRSLSRGLIVIQYCISVILIIAVMVIQKQTSYALDNSLGGGNANLICMDNVHSDIQKDFAKFKDKLLVHTSVSGVSAMFEEPGGHTNDMFRYTMEGFVEDESVDGDDLIGIFPCDYSFPEIFNLVFLAGESFSPEYEDPEGSGEYIINESAMRKLGYSRATDIVGKQFGLSFWTPDIPIPEGRIRGVVSDFHLSSLKRKVEPLVLFKRKDLWLISLVIAFNPEMQEEALRDIEATWEEFFPQFPFRFDFVDSMYREVYSTERLQARLLTLFTIIALFICSMGLLGLSLLSTQRRMKEIGIRRVNGAKSGQIMARLNFDFLKWVVLAYLLALLPAWMVMAKWQDSFVYKTELSWWIFAFAGVIILIIALLTVSLQTWRASRKNPVEALRYE